MRPRLRQLIAPAAASAALLVLGSGATTNHLQNAVLSGFAEVRGPMQVTGNLSVAGAITAGAYRGDGSALAGVLKPADSNGLVTAAVTNGLAGPSVTNGLAGPAVTNGLAPSELLADSRRLSAALAGDYLSPGEAPYLMPDGGDTLDAATYDQVSVTVSGLSSAFATTNLGIYLATNDGASWVPATPMQSFVVPAAATSFAVRFFPAPAHPFKVALTNSSPATTTLELLGPTWGYELLRGREHGWLGDNTNNLYPATNPSNFVTAAITNGIGGGPNIDADTNWWAIITVDDPAAFGNPGNPLWTDVVVKCWTNGPVHYGDATPVLAYSTTDPALNGAPAWEDFSTNWYPRVFYCQVHTSHDISWLAEWKHISPTHDSSIEATTAYWDGADSASNPFRWVVMFRDTRPWFHPASNLSWAVTLQNGANSPSVKARDGETTLNNTVWLKVAPMWVNYDPRPRKAREFWNGGAGEVNFTNQHQKP